MSASVPLQRTAPLRLGHRIEKKVAHLIVEELAAHGIRTVFGLPGGAISAVYDALLDHPEIRLVTTRTETGAMFAAVSHARHSGQTGCVLVTSGPGALNALTGLVTAGCENVPLLLLTGEVPRKNFGRNTLQDGSTLGLDLVAAARPLCKLATMVSQPAAAVTAITSALAIARSGRQGPVLVDLPLDVTMASAPATRATVAQSTARAVVDPAVCDSVLAALCSAERPVILAGSGVKHGSGAALLRVFAERFQLPVVTTPKAKGVFPESHPLSLGVHGHGGHRAAVEYLEKGCDVVVVLGSGLSDPASDGWSARLKASKAFVHVDVDIGRVGRSYDVDLAIGASVEVFLEGMLAIADKHVRSAAPDIQRFAPHPSVDPNGAVTPAEALVWLQRTFPAPSIFNVDIGEHMFFATHYLAIDTPDSFNLMTGLASMGSSIPAAIGSALAHPDRRSIAICGDGCFMMSLPELITATHERAPIIVAVFNDQRYGMVELGHASLYGRTPPFPAGPVDIRATAEACGAQSYVVSTLAELDALAKQITNEEKTIVLDIRISRAAVMPKNQRFTDLASS